jgi:hypothetical protein
MLLTGIGPTYNKQKPPSAREPIGNHTSKFGQLSYLVTVIYSSPCSNQYTTDRSLNYTGVIIGEKVPKTKKGENKRTR